jgi:hypothetical protein
MTFSSYPTKKWMDGRMGNKEEEPLLSFVFKKDIYNKQAQFTLLYITAVEEYTKMA